MSLVAWYPLNGNLKDRGLLGNDLINSNNSVITVNNNGKIGRCYEDLTTSYAYLEASQPILLNQTHSMFCWVCPEVLTTSSNLDGVLGNHIYTDSDPSNTGITLKRISDTTYKVSLNTANTSNQRTYVTYCGNTTLNINEWHHIGFTYDGKKIRIYVDGKVDGEVDYTNMKFSSQKIRIFSWSNVYTQTTYTGKKKINDVRIYDHCLSKTEVKEIAKGLVLHYPLNSGYGNENLMKMGGLDKNGATSMTYNSSTDTYTIVSPAGTNIWGYGVSIRSTSEISIPYGKSYRASVEVYVPTQHSFVADINNNVANGTTAWAGNDNDNTSKRTSTSFTIPANTWKKISWGSENSNGNNTDKVAILPYDKLGLRTNSDTDSVTWYLRHPKIEIGTSVTDWCPNKNDALYSTLGYDSATVYDTSGFGNDGTKKGEGLTYSENTALYDSSTVFTGNDNKDCVKCKNFLSSGSKVNEITLSCWVWCEKNQTFVGCPNFIALGSNSFIRYRMQSSTSLWAYGLVGTSNKSWQYSCSQINDGKWHNPVFTFKNGIGTLYLDGEEIGSTDYSSTATYLTCNWTDWLIGAYQEGNETWIGNISDARIYITALSAEDIKQLYESRARIDKNGNVYCNQFIEDGIKTQIKKNSEILSQNFYENGNIEDKFGLAYNTTRGEYIGKEWSFTPTTADNSTFQFALVQQAEAPKKQYHLSLTVEWSGFDTSNTRGTFDIYWQEYWFRISDETWQWSNTPIGKALDSNMRLYDMVLSAESGIYQYEVDFTTSSDIKYSWMRLRSNYSNGTGKLKFSNLSIVPKQYYLDNKSKVKSGNDYIISNEIIEI